MNIDKVPVEVLTEVQKRPELAEMLKNGHDMQLFMTLHEEFTARVSASRDQFTSMNDAERLVWVERYLGAIIHECGEVRDNFKWKWWKKHQVTNMEEARKELVDVLLFTYSLAFVLGYQKDGSDLMEELFSKLRINHARQDNKY